MMISVLGARGTELSCWAGGYRQDAWLAYCNSKRYGVYDVEAVWHRLESDVAPRITTAQVLSLSDSHLQNALSLGNASDWFATHGYRAYLLGLPTAESAFGERLLDNFRPHPQVVILDASPYFTGNLGKFEQPIFEDPTASRNAVSKLKDFQNEHREFCERLPWACGHTFAYFRSRADGHWIFPQQSTSIWIGYDDVPNDAKRFPVNSTPNEDLARYPIYLAAAKRLVARLDMPKECIVITHVPSQEDLDGLAQHIGGALGLTVIEPRTPDLATFDRSHLTPASSARWTKAFLQELEPVLRRCIPGASAPAAALH